MSDAVIVRPGDKLVIGLSSTITQQQASDIRERLAERLPGVEAIIIGSCSGLAVYEPAPLAPEDSRFKDALRQIWNHIEESDLALSNAWLRRVIVESGAWKGEPDPLPPLADRLRAEGLPEGTIAMMTAKD